MHAIPAGNPLGSPAAAPYDWSGNDEPAGLPGRKTELGQLIKLLNFAKSGQAKSVLLTGDPGVGKTALLDAFVGQIRGQHLGRVLKLDEAALLSVEHCYVAFIESLQAECQALLEEALDHAREYTAELGLEWDVPDLMRAVALVKLQESIGGKEATTQGQLVKAIRSSVPTLKKLKPSINDAIERLVTLIVNPWLSVATAIASPISPRFQESLALAKKLKMALEAHEACTPFDMHGDAVASPPHDSSGAPSPASAVVELAANGGTLSVTSPSPGTALVPQMEDMPSMEDALSLPVDTLAQHVGELLQFIAQSIQGLDTALVIALDSWDAVGERNDARRERLKNFIVGLLKATTEQKNTRMMLLVAARSEGESDTLGGLLYPMLRNKLLLSGLQGKARKQVFKDPLTGAGLKIDDWIVGDVMELTRGNPLWLSLLSNSLLQRAQANKINWIDGDFYRKLALNHPQDVLELGFTRIKLMFLDNERALHKLLGAIVSHYGLNPFNAADAVRELAASQNVPEQTVFAVLHYLYQERWIMDAEPGTPPQAAARAGERAVRYRLLCRRVVEFIRLKTQAVQVDVSTDEKLHYLRKIIPLSVASGELDRKKTQDVLQLCQAMENTEMVGFLEETFLAYLAHEKPVVRATALNNLALLGGNVAFQKVIQGMTDPDAMVREYAAQNLIAMGMQLSSSALNDQVTDVLIKCLDDDSDVVRTLAYQGLAKYKGGRDLLPVFVKGMSDAAESVRMTCAQSLVTIGSDSPLLRNALLDAVTDGSEAVRKIACAGLQAFPGSDTLRLLGTLLRHDASSGVRALAAEVLSGIDHPEAQALLMDVLHREANENVRIAVVRALAKQKSARAEDSLVQLLDRTDPEAFPALLWVAIKSLGDIAMTSRTLQTLELFDAGDPGSILRSATDAALERIRRRLDEWRRFQAETGNTRDVTPAAFADEEDLPAPDIPVYEEEALIEF